MNLPTGKWQYVTFTDTNFGSYILANLAFLDCLLSSNVLSIWFIEWHALYASLCIVLNSIWLLNQIVNQVIEF